MKDSAKITLTVKQLRDLVRQVKAGEVDELDVVDMLDAQDREERDRDYYDWLVTQDEPNPDEY